MADYTCPTACVESNHPGREHDAWLALDGTPEAGNGGGLIEAEWSDVLATLPENPEEADGWELSLVRRTVARILAAREAAAEQRGREQGWDEGHEVCEWPNCLKNHVNPYRERA